MTIISDSSHWPRRLLRTDVVVIGAGPAGITIARDLERHGLGVVVLESGERIQTARARDLNDGKVVGDPFRFGRRGVGLMDVRMRALGGSSGHWNGLCRPLETYDFDERPELGRSGWDLDRTELEPWYRMAHSTCDMGRFGYDAAKWFAAHGGSPPFVSDGLETVLYRFSPTDFGAYYQPDLQASSLSVLLDATVTALALSADRRHVRRVTVSSSSGASVEIESEIVVVAAGGIETPRLLLENDLANRSGLVGRGFMEHPHVRLGRIALSGDFNDVSMYRPIEGRGQFTGTMGWSGLALTEQVMREQSLLAGALTLEAAHAPADAPSSELASGIAELIHGVDTPARFWSATLRTEQLASPNNMVTLGSTRNRLGNRLPTVRWDVDPSTIDALRRLVRALAVEFGRAGLGRLEMTEDGTPLRAGDVEIGCHHMGTARMSTDPRRGVVDRDCFSHDISNLCVAGSSVFPTSGYANPTLTVVALAHRLADEITRRLS